MPRQVDQGGNLVRGDVIGRDRELAELLAGFLDATEGRGGVFLITGEAGIGKTAIANQLAARAAERGALVLWGRCWEGGGAPPYWPWAQIIRAVAEGRDEEHLRSFASSGAAEIALLVPELAMRLRVPTDRLRPIESDARRFYVFEAVTSFLRAASQPHPIVLVIDDLHDADQPSVLLLRYLISDVRRSRMQVLATYREAVPDAQAEDVLAALAREGMVLGLQGLDRDEVGRLVEQVSGSVPLPDKVTEIYEATDGNPLFVGEVTRLMAAHDRLTSQGRLGISIPQSVRAVIRRRLLPLSADAVRVLSAAAVAGRDFDLRLVSAASGLASDRIFGSLAEAVALGLIGEEATGVYRFSHPLMREVIYDELPVDARIEGHRLIGEAIEGFGADDPRQHLAQLAYHFAKVAPAGEAQKARDYARRAGDRAMESCAYEEAVVEYRRALDALTFASPDEDLRCELLLSRGGALVRAGDYEEARTTFLAAFEVARQLGDAERLAVAALGFGEPQVQAGVADRRLMDLLREACDALSPGDGALRARILSRLCLELTFSGETELRESLSLEALEMARRLNEVVSLASALRARWLAVWGPDGLEERTSIAEEILRLGGATGDRETELIGRARRMTCAMEAGDIRLAEADIVAHSDLANELRMPYHQWVAASMRAMRALLDGSLGAAEGLAGEALAMLPKRQDAVFAHLNQITQIRRDQGRLGEMRETWQQIVERFPQVGFARGCLCLADLELGRQEDAQRCLRSLAEAIDELPRNGVNWLAALAVASIAAARLDDVDAAASVHRLLLPYADRTIVISAPHPVVCFGSASLYVALLERTISGWQEAEKHFETAIEANSRLGARSLLAFTHLEYARTLFEQGRAGDRVRARGLLDRSAATAKALEMDGLLDDIERLRALDAGSPIAAGTGGNTIRREGEYWTVVYEGSLVRLRDSKGLRYLATLLANPGREFHVLDLESEEHRGAPSPSARRRWSEAEGMTVRPDLGDAGELLDASAKAAYKARLDDLEEEVAEAESFNDSARAAKAKEEIDFIASELARAVGLGGRDRRAAAHAERARLNVTRAIRASMENLARALPALGQHLSSTVRTGRYCSYTPDPRAEIAWEL